MALRPAARGLGRLTQLAYEARPRASRRAYTRRHTTPPSTAGPLTCDHFFEKKIKKASSVPSDESASRCGEGCDSTGDRVAQRRAIAHRARRDEYQRNASRPPPAAPRTTPCTSPSGARPMLPDDCLVRGEAFMDPCAHRSPAAPAASRVPEPSLISDVTLGKQLMSGITNDLSKKCHSDTANPRAACLRPAADRLRIAGPCSESRASYRHFETDPGRKKNVDAIAVRLKIDSGNRLTDGLKTALRAKQELQAPRGVRCLRRDDSSGGSDRPAALADDTNYSWFSIKSLQNKFLKKKPSPPNSQRAPPPSSSSKSKATTTETASPCNTTVSSASTLNPSSSYISAPPSSSAHNLAPSCTNIIKSSESTPKPASPCNTAPPSPSRVKAALPYDTTSSFPSNHKPMSSYQAAAIPVPCGESFPTVSKLFSLKPQSTSMAPPPSPGTDVLQKVPPTKLANDK